MGLGDPMGDVGFCDLQLVSALIEHWSIYAIRGDVITQSCPNPIVAGGLHLWLWVMRQQGDQLKFDSREMMRTTALSRFEIGAGQHVLVL